MNADGDEESGLGNMKAPCRLPLPAGNGRPTIGVGLQSTDGRIRARRNGSKDGANEIGCVDVSGVNVERGSVKYRTMILCGASAHRTFPAVFKTPPAPRQVKLPISG